MTQSKITKQEALQKIEELKAYVEQCDKEQENGTGVFVPKPYQRRWIVRQDGFGEWETGFDQDLKLHCGNPCFRTKEHAEAWAEFNETMMKLRMENGQPSGGWKDEWGCEWRIEVLHSSWTVDRSMYSRANIHWAVDNSDIRAILERAVKILMTGLPE